jgi:hypothetical protein
VIQIRHVLAWIGGFFCRWITRAVVAAARKHSRLLGMGVVYRWHAVRTLIPQRTSLTWIPLRI